MGLCFSKFTLFSGLQLRLNHKLPRSSLCEHLPNTDRLLGLPDKPEQPGSWMFSAQTSPPAPDCFLLFSEQSSVSFYFFRNTLFRTRPVWAHFSKTENRDGEQTVTDFLHVQRSKLSWPFSKSLESALALPAPRGLRILFKGFSALPCWVLGGGRQQPPPPAAAHFPMAADKYRLLKRDRNLWFALKLAPCFQRFAPVNAAPSWSCPLGPTEVLLLLHNAAVSYLGPFVWVTCSAVSFGARFPRDAFYILVFSCRERRLRWVLLHVHSEQPGLPTSLLFAGQVHHSQRRLGVWGHPVGDVHSV